MLSEAKIVIGRYDEYVTLPVTVLATLKKMSFVNIETMELVTLNWSKKTKTGLSVLLVNGKPGIEPTDGYWLQRSIDEHGLKDFSFIEPM